MKLFYCEGCKDIVAIRARMRRCYCGSSSGSQPVLGAITLTGLAIPLEISDATLNGAVRTQEEYKSKPFFAAVMGKRNREVVYAAEYHGEVLESVDGAS